MPVRVPSLTSADVTRWLRTDARDVVRIEPIHRTSGAAQSLSESQPLDAGLARWRRRVARRRLAVVIRRQLVIALALGVVLELIGLATGASTATRAWWLIAPALLGLGGVAAGVRRAPRIDEVARLLDHDLGLAERLGTAIELEPSANSRSGLGAIVLAEGAAAAWRSLAVARAALRPASREWGALLVLGVVLAAVLVLPASGATVPRGIAARRAPVQAASAKARAAGEAAHSHVAPPPRSSTPGAGGKRPPALGIGNTPASAGESRELAQGPSAGKPSRGPPPKQLAAGSNGAVAPSATASAGQTGESATAGPAGRAGAAAGGQASSRAGSASSTRRNGGSVGGFGSATKPASGAQAGVGAPNSPGASGAASKTPSGRGLPGSSSHAPPGGEAAGHARGSTTEAQHPAAPKLGTAAAGLPIQSGYTPSRSSHGSANSGNAATSGGGSGPGRGAKAGGGGGGSAVTFPYIPPTPSSVASLDQDLLLSYFGSFSGLMLTSW